MEFKNTAELDIADTLSRLINNQDSPNEELVIAAVIAKAEVSAIFTNAFENLPFTSEEVRKHTCEDPVLKKICSYLKSGWPAKTEGEIQSFYQKGICFRHANQLSPASGYTPFKPTVQEIMDFVDLFENINNNAVDHEQVPVVLPANEPVHVTISGLQMY